MEKLFGTDGVRGRANVHPITPELALQLGKAIATVFAARGHGSRRAIIGKDTRLSGYMLETALTSGLVSMGMDVYLVGPMPTPAIAHLTRSMATDCGIMITASHNPAEDNGIKIFDAEGYKLSDDLEAQIERLIWDGEISSAHIAFDQIGKARRIDDARGRYLESAKGTVGHLDLRGLRVAIDCANGAAYAIGPVILEELGAEVFTLGVNPDGYNINSGCGALSPGALARTVVETHADLGIALDGDADRVVFVDRLGNVVEGDRILGLCARELERQGRLRQQTLAVTVASNLGLRRAMRACGIETLCTAVGDRHVIEALRERQLAFGGEESGHLIFLDHSTTGDGLISALQVLRVLRQSNQPLHELCQFVTLFPTRKRNLPVREKRDLKQLSKLQEVLRACTAALGEDGRHLVRYSGTENLLRILVEAPDDRLAAEWVERIAAAALTELG